MTPLMPKKIIDYATLKQAIASTADRSDEEFNAATENFIRMAESVIYTDLRTPANQTSITHDAQKLGAPVNIPDSMLEIRDVYRNGIPIDRLTSDEYFSSIAGRNKKTGYARVGNELVFSPKLDTSATDKDVIKIFFWIDWSLVWSKDTDTNPLLLGNSDLYLWGCLAEAFLWLSDDQKAMFYDGRFQRKIDSIKQQARNDDQSGGDLAVRGRYL